MQDPWTLAANRNEELRLSRKLVAMAVPQQPTPIQISQFLNVVRSMNGGKEPEVNGPLWDVWKWLKQRAMDYSRAES